MEKMSRGRLAVLFAWLCMLLVPAAAWAQTYTYSIYVNSDANAGTGCAEGPVTGADVRLQVSATGGQTPEVQQVTRSRCSGGLFSATSAIAGSYPVGANNGIGGSDVIELSDSLQELSSSGSPSLIFSIVATSSAGQDELLTSNGVVGGPLIGLGLPAVQLPMLGAPAMILMGVLLVVFGVRVARRRGLWRLMALLSLLSGVAIAANFVVDGQVGDWNGATPLATDAAGDASSGESAIDLRAFFAAIENERVYMRVDVTNLQNNGPTALAGSATTLEDQSVTVSLSGSDNENDPLTFAIVTPPVNGVLGAIVPTGPQTATVQYTPNADSNGSDAFTFTVDDSQVTSAPASVALTVTPVNDVPSFAAGSDQTVLEDAGAQSANGWATGISAGPANEAGQTVDFIVGNDNNALFSAQPALSATGVLTYTPAANASGSATVTVSLHDDGGTANGGIDTSAPQTFTINVTGVNDAPSFVAGPDQSVAENSPAQTVDPWATAISAGAADESGQTLNFTISNDNNALFSVQPAVSAAGVLTFTPAATINGSATVTLTLVDDGGTANGGIDTSTAQTFTISVVGINDPPSFTVGPDQTVVEDAGAQSVNPWATAISAGPPNETGQVVSFNVTNNSNAALFSAGPAISSTGVLTYTPADNASGSATITLVAMDDGGTANGGNDTSPPQTFQINVTAVNDAPALDLNGAAVGTDFSTTYTEGGPALAIVDPANLTLIDADSANLASATVTITNLLDGAAEALAANTGGTAITASYVAGTLTLSGSDTVANYQTVLRTITYINNSTAPNETARTITFVANDGASNGNIATSTVAVVGVNTVPSFTGGAPVIINEDAVAQSIAAWATAINDNDGGAQTLNFSVTSTGGTLTFSSAPALTPTGTLTFTTAPDASGSATFAVVLTDNGSNNNTSAAQTLTITANAVNDAPSFTAGAAQTVQEDSGVQTVAGWATAISPGPADESGQAVSFTITGNTNASLFSAAPVVSPTGTLSFTPAADAFGSATISLVLMDNGGTTNGGIDTSAVQSFDITIAGINDAPGFVVGPNQAVDDNVGAQTVNPWATALSTGPANEGGQTLSFVIDSNSAPGIFSVGPTISPTGVLTYTPATIPTGTTTATIVLHAMDDGGTANGGINISATQSFTIAITHANTVPTLTDPVIDYATAGNTQLLVAGATLPGLVAITDPDSALAKSIPIDPDGPSAPSVIPATGSSGNGGTYAINAAGAFSYVPPAGFAGIDSFTFQVTDMNTPTPGVAVGTINITVGPTIWYVSNLVNADNPAGGDGRSTNAFDTLAGAQTASIDGDIIFVFNGSSAATPLTGGIVLKNGQRLWGEGYGLNVAPFGVLVAAGTQPRINAGGADAVSIPATTGNRTGVEVRGLDLQGSNGVDVTATGTNNVGVTIAGNTVRGSTIEGIDVNFGATGTQQIAIQDVAVTAGGTGIDVTRTAGTATITAFGNNTINGNTGGTGILVNGMIFDATPGNPINVVSGGTTVIGASGNGTGSNGMLLQNVVGNLDFTDLDIYNDAGTGLGVSSTGVLNAGAGTGFRISVGALVATVNSTGGPAIDIANASISLPLNDVRSTNSTTTGISLVNAFGGAGSTAFSATGTSQIVDPGAASGTAFRVDGGNGNITYAGNITSSSGNAVVVTNRSSDAVTLSGSIIETGSGISLTNNTGATIAFSGPLTLATGTSPAFTATGGGSVTASNTTSTVATTTATSINIANTTIGAAGLNFRSVNAGTGASGPASGISLNNTGSLGGLTVSGTGSAGSGGTIQNTTGNGITLVGTRNPSLSFMSIQGSADDGINGASVAGISLINTNVINNGNSTVDEGIELTNPSGAMVLTNVIASGNAHNNVSIDDADNVGGNSSLAVSGSTFSVNTAANGNHGMLMQVRGTAVLGVSTIGTSTFSSNRSLGLQVITGDTATISDLTVAGSTFSTTTAQVQQIAMDMAKGQASNMTVRVLGNTITGQNSHGMNFFTAAGAGTTGIYNARIENNTVGNAAIAGSGSLIGNCMRININGDSDATVLVNGNTLRQCPNGRGVEVIGRNGVGGLDITVTNNDVIPNDVSGFPLASIFVQSNAVTIPNTVRSDIRGNTVPPGATFDLLPTYIAVVETGTSTSELVDTAPASASCTAQLTSVNTGSASASAGCALIPGPIPTPP